MNRRSETIGIVLVVLFVVALLSWQYLDLGGSSDAAVADADRVQTAELLEDLDRGAQVGDDGRDDATVVLYDRTIAVDELPPEAIDTLLLIDDDGPYPYRKDGSTFQNREGLLPDRPVGHYREFTVETPGSADRGARRIVSGADGELYWTADHYDSFEQIVGW